LRRRRLLGVIGEDGSTGRLGLRRAFHGRQRHDQHQTTKPCMFHDCLNSLLASEGAVCRTEPTSPVSNAESANLKFSAQAEILDFYAILPDPVHLSKLSLAELDSEESNRNDACTVLTFAGQVHTMDGTLRAIAIEIAIHEYAGVRLSGIQPAQCHDLVLFFVPVGRRIVFQILALTKHS
jgi:hypothetical protein